MPEPQEVTIASNYAQELAEAVNDIGGYGYRRYDSGEPHGPHIMQPGGPDPLPAAKNLTTLEAWIAGKLIGRSRYEAIRRNESPGCEPFWEARWWIITGAKEHTISSQSGGTQLEAAAKTHIQAVAAILKEKAIDPEPHDPEPPWGAGDTLKRGSDGMKSTILAGPFRGRWPAIISVEGDCYLVRHSNGLVTSIGISSTNTDRWERTAIAEIKKGSWVWYRSEPAIVVGLLAPKHPRDKERPFKLVRLADEFDYSTGRVCGKIACNGYAARHELTLIRPPEAKP